MRRIGGLFELAFEPEGLFALDDTTVVLRMNVKFTARLSGRSIPTPGRRAVGGGGRVGRSEVFLSDPAALLDTLLAV